MVETKVMSLATAVAVAFAAVSCTPTFRWEKSIMDGHRTGVRSVIGSEVSEALGLFDEGVYTSPNGTSFDSGSTPAVAEIMIELQPQMSYLKEVIGYSPVVMEKSTPEGVLSDWAVDALAKGIEASTGVRPDMTVLNLGGIRLDMPQGDVLIDDIVSMFPFHNYLCCVRLSGADVRVILENMAATKFQALSGVRVVAENGRLVSAEIGGKPLDDNREYMVGTIDFLLDGGDGLFLAKNARALYMSEVKVNEWMVPYIRSLTAEGKNVEYQIDGRITVR